MDYVILPNNSQIHVWGDRATRKFVILNFGYLFIVIYIYALRYSDANCTNVDHRNDIKKFYDNITESMSKASEAIFDNNCAGTNRRSDTHSIPG